MKSARAPYYPVFLDLAGRKCVVVGGGAVALRKVRTLLEHGAEVLVISPELGAELGKLVAGGRIRALSRDYRRGDLRGVFLAIAATDSVEVNREVAQEARAGGVLVNVVDDAADSDFIVPSYLRRGDVTLAVSTSGRSPALARRLKTKFEAELGSEYAALTTLVDEVRAESRRWETKPTADDWQDALDLDLLVGLLKRGEREEARAVLIEGLRHAVKVAVERGSHAT